MTDTSIKNIIAAEIKEPKAEIVNFKLKADENLDENIYQGMLKKGRHCTVKSWKQAMMVFRKQYLMDGKHRLDKASDDNLFGCSPIQMQGLPR